MATNQTNDRRALGILSDTVAEKLGPSDKVTREIRRAYTSGKQIDRFMARAAFDALPGWQRTDIGSAARHLAHAIIQEALQGEPFQQEALQGEPFQTERDWRDMEAPRPQVRTAPRQQGGGELAAPPRFLTRSPR